MAPPFEAHVVGNEALVMPTGEEDTVRVPVPVARLLGVCDRLRSLDQHCQEAISRWSLPASEAGAVRQALEQLVANGLLIDQADIVRRIRSVRTTDQPDPTWIETLCIRTCNRPGELARILDELLVRENYPRGEILLIIDDSTDQKNIIANQAIVETARAKTTQPLVLIDRRRRSDLTRHIAENCACSIEALNGIIEGNPDDPEASYGAGFNLALLLSAGGRCLMIDDDVSMAVHLLDDSSTAVRLCEGHSFRSRFPDLNAEESGQYPLADVDPIGAHGELLGCSPSDLIDRSGSSLDVLLSGLTPQMLHDLQRQARVRLTGNGIFGDVGTGSMAWLFTLPAETLRTLARDESRYREIARSRRLAMCPPQVQIAFSRSLMTTPLVGIDNRDYLLPTLAKGRGEDLIFGACVRFLHPGAMTASLPWMLGHRLKDVRSWDSNDLDKGMTINPATYLSTRIEALAELDLAEDPSIRASFLTEWFANLAAMSPKSLGADLRRHVLSYRSSVAQAVAENGRQLDPPDWLRRDLQALIDRHTTLNDWDEQRVALMVEDIRRQAHLMAKGLPAWAMAWQWCKVQGRDQLLAQGKTVK